MYVCLYVSLTNPYDLKLFAYCALLRIMPEKSVRQLVPLFPFKAKLSVYECGQ